MIKKYVILCILFLSYNVSNANVRLYADPVTVNAGDNFKVNIKVDGFVAVAGYQFAVKWDQTKFSYVSLGDLSALNLDVDENFSIFQSEGKIRTTWADPSSENASLVDGTILFSITFNGICGSQSFVDFVNDGFFMVQFFNSDGDNVDHTVQAANVTISGSPCGGAQTVLSAGSVSGASGTQVCVPIITGTGFTAVTALTADINLSSTCATFDEIKNITSSLPGFSIANINTSQAGSGIIKLQWTSTASVTLQAGQTLFELCYTPGSECCDQTVPLTFTNINFIQGGSNNNLADNGSITINCGGVEPCNTSGLAMIASDHCGLPNDIIKMDFSVNSFADIQAMQFSIDWDGDCLEFLTDSIIIPPDRPVTGLNAGKFNDTGNDCIIVLWDEASGGSVTLPDGTVIFSLKFRIKGGLGSVCNVNISGKCISGGIEVLNSAGQSLTLDVCSGDVEVKECAGAISIVDRTLNNESCAGSCDGAIAFDVVGASNPTYAWSVSGLNGNSVTGLCSGTYTVTVTDGDLTATKTYTITSPPAIVIQVAAVTPATSGNIGAVDINVSGGTGAFTYTWNTTPPATTQDVSNLAKGTYTVTVTDSGNGCTATQTVVVGDGSGAFGVEINATKIGNYDISCADACDGVLSAQVSGGLSPYTYRWSRDNATTAILSDVCAGTYTVTVTDNGNNTTTKSYTILAPDKIVLDFAIDYPTDDQTNDGSIEVIVVGGLDPYTYSWTGPITAVTKQINNAGVGAYSVSVTDASGCTATASRHLTPGGKGCYYGIGAITPNGDGKNDRLIISCVAGVTNNIQIFNRWGKLVYAQAGYSNDWEGVSNQGEQLPDGGYYWVLEVREAGGNTQIFKGSVSIIRSLR